MGELTMDNKELINLLSDNKQKISKLGWLLNL